MKCYQKYIKERIITWFQNYQSRCILNLTLIMLYSIFLSNMSGGKHHETKFTMVKDYHPLCVCVCVCVAMVYFMTWCTDTPCPQMTKKETESSNICKLSFPHSLLSTTPLGVQTLYALRKHASIRVHTLKAWYDIKVKRKE